MAQFNAVTQLLEVLAAGSEPLLQSLSQAPIEEEEITPETAAALDRSRASMGRGESISHEEILREFGLTKWPIWCRTDYIPSATSLDEAPRVGRNRPFCI